MLFRTEEIIDPSTTPPKHNGFRGKDLLNSTALKPHPNALCTVRTGVFDVHPFVWISAVDQQQKINRSSDFKPLAPVYLDPVREEIDEPGGPPRVFRINTVAASPFGGKNSAKLLEER